MEMYRRVLILVFLINISIFNLVTCKKQQLSLSDSYLPVVMQVMAHLTDQMAFEVKDDPNVKPTVKPPRPGKPPASPSKPPASPPRPTMPPKPLNEPIKPVTSRPTTVAWWATMPTTNRIEQTTQFHKPGLYAPIPPKGGDKYIPKEFFVLLPISNNSQYTVLQPNEPNSDTLLEPQIPDEVRPLVEPKPEIEHLLPPALEVPVSRTDDGLSIDDDDEITDDNLQYLAPELKEMIKLAHDPNDERAIDFWDDSRKAMLQQSQNKGKLSSSNLRLLLLYDLLSREAKRLKLSDYSGFSEQTLKELTESSAGGARAQLSFVLSKMLDRKDCQHDYANNRAREMVAELAKDESLMSNEIRYLQPLVYKL